MPTSPEQAMAVIHGRFGAHAGHRALHAKGVICTATFTATPKGVALTRAAHMSGDPVPATVRFSNGGGDRRPRSRTRRPRPRGELPAPRRLAHRQIRPPRRCPLLSLVCSPRARLLAQRLFRPTAFHAYKWIDADGGGRWVRYTWRPTLEEPEPSREEAKRRGADYLFDDLAQRLERGSVRMLLELQIAGEGDDPHDPSDEWPPTRERVIAGTLEVTATDPAADDGIVFDPTRVTDGIEPSDDPVLKYRPVVYDLSHRRRTAGGLWRPPSRPLAPSARVA